MAVFIVADEVFIVYEVEETHLQLFIAQFLSLLTVVLLPNAPTGANPPPVVRPVRDERSQDD